LDYNITNHLSGFTSYLWNPRTIRGSLPNSAISVGGTSPPAPAGYAGGGPIYSGQRGGRENSNIFNSQLTWTPTSKFVITAGSETASLTASSALTHQLFLTLQLLGPTLVTSATTTRAIPIIN